MTDFIAGALWDSAKYMGCLRSRWIGKKQAWEDGEEGFIYIYIYI